MQAIYITDIKIAVAARCGLSIAELEGPRRARRFARPRQIAFLLCRELTSSSFPVIGLRFGGRDHTTVIHGVRAMTALAEHNPKYAGMLSEIRATLAAKDISTRERIAAAVRSDPALLAAASAAASSAQVAP